MASRPNATWLIVGVLAITTLPAQTPARVKTVFAEPARILVGQKVGFAIEVIPTGQFEGNPVFDLPRVSGAVLLQIPGRPIFGSAEIDGESYTSYRFDFALYPHRPGDHTIPKIQVRGSVVTEIGKPSRPFTLQTETIEFAAELPPGAERLSTLISTAEFIVQDSWQPEPARAIVGDAFTRTVTMRARDVLGMALPLLPVPKIDGLRVYPRRPVVADKIERGDITGVLEQTFVYLCERPGTYAIPRLTISWFNLDTGTLQKRVLAGVSFDVEPDPEAAAKNGAVTSGFGPIWPILITLLGLGIATWGLRHRFRTFLRTHRDRDALWLARVRAACRQDDARATLVALMRCLDRAGGADTTPTATRWAASTGDADLEREVAALQHAFVTGQSWDGAGLRRILPRRIILDPAASARQHHVLDGLNPL